MYQWTDTASSARTWELEDRYSFVLVNQESQKTQLTCFSCYILSLSIN